METGCNKHSGLTASQTQRRAPTILKHTIAYSSFATETISIMSVQSATPTTAQPASTLTRKGVATAGAITWLGTTGNTMFGMPASITLPQFDRTGWSNWSGILEALLALHEVEDMFILDAHPTGVNTVDWNSIQRRTKVYLHLYVKQDVYSLIADDTAFPTFKHKWDRLSATYGGTLGSTTIFNLWIQLTQA